MTGIDKWFCPVPQIPTTTAGSAVWETGSDGWAEAARKDACIRDAIDILARIKRGQNTKHVLQLRDDAVAFLKVGIGEEGKA